MSKSWAKEREERWSVHNEEKGVAECLKMGKEEFLLHTDSELQPSFGLIKLALDTLHILHDTVCPTSFNLLPLVRGTDSDDGSTRSNASADSRRRVFEDDTPE